jgi:tetratricopeptide (TPR) repeat protein
MDKVLKDFFISYRGLDQPWAEWIAYHLEEANYSVVIQAWDFQPGSSFIHAMDKATREAQRTIAVLSPEYFASPYTTVEWQAAYHKDPTGEQGFLLPVRVRPCQVEGLLGPLVYIDLVDLDEAKAKEKLMAGVHRHDQDQPKRAKPAGAPGFPGKVQHSVAEPQSFPGAFPPLWHMPFRRNPFFTGREELLKHLRDNLTTSQAAAIVHLVQAQAISGLGGIGKTQTAVEYAYRYYHTYRAVLWVNAAARDALITSYVELAALLTLPERQEQDQNKIVAAVKRWFTTHEQWLLIVDNADDLSLAEDFLPAAGHGHLLLTTRASAPGTLAQRIEVEKMDLDESMLLLLRRARVLAPGGTLDQASATDRDAAEALAREMDGLPLALDQAGAYIEETQSRLSAYLGQYRQRHVRFLQRRGGSGTQHPEPVAKTWSLSFEKVEQLDPAAADLLRFCAFLAPDAIPEQLILDAASELGTRLQPMAADPSLLDEAIGTLLRYSLVKRKPDEQTIAVHRLVQAILKTSMDAATQQAWAESTVRALDRAFPDVTDYRNWSQCQQYLPHAQACALLIDQWQMAFPETGSLLNKVGYYLKQRAQYGEAELLYQRTIAIGEKVLGPEHPNLAIRLNNLANLYQDQGKYGEAEPLYRRSLSIFEKVLGKGHRSTETVRANYASFLEEMEQKGKG